VHQLCFFNLISCSFTQRLFFLVLEYQILQGFTNGTHGKNRSFLPHIHVWIFFFFNRLILDCEILPICNSLLIYKREKKPNIIMINKNIKYLLPLQLRPCSFLNLMTTRLKNDQNIIGLQESMNNQLVNNA
jgi:hypothetical protein